MFKVLIVDDEIYVVALIRKLIDWDKFDMKVEGTANDGITALNMVKEINPDLVIVDIRMPGYKGIFAIHFTNFLIFKHAKVSPTLSSILDFPFSLVYLKL